MKIVKYKINSDGTIPKEIDDGGYFRNPVTEEMVGFSNSDKLAIGQVELTELELKTLVSDLDLKKEVELVSMTLVEKEEEKYHIMKAFEQGLCAARSHQGWIDEGNQIYFTQIGINGSQAQKEMTLFLQEENKKLNSDVMPTHEDQLLWLNSMYEKFKGCSIEYAKSKGMSVVSEIALLKEVKE